MKQRFKNLRPRTSGWPIGSAEAGQIRLFGPAQEASAAFGCPTAFQQAVPVEFLPERRTDQGKEPGETVAPASQPGAEAQEDISPQGGSDLPAHGVGVMAQKVRQWEGLFEFLEEGSVLQFADDAKLEVVFGAGYPKDFAPRPVGQMRAVHVSLVEDDDFARMDIGAQFAGAEVVMLGRRADDGAGGPEGLEIKPDMTLGGGLAPTMFGPIQRARHQGDGGGVHDMNEALLEPEGEAGRVLAGEGGLQGFQMIECRPEELFGHLGIAGAIGVGERVFGRCRGRAQGRKRAGVQAQGVTHVIETEAGWELNTKLMLGRISAG